jgi:hypothetical protein
MLADVDTVVQLLAEIVVEEWENKQICCNCFNCSMHLSLTLFQYTSFVDSLTDLDSPTSQEETALIEMPFKILASAEETEAEVDVLAVGRG